VTRIVNQVGAEMAADPEWKDRLLETPTLTRVPALGDLGITVRVAGKVRPTDRWTAPSELRKRLIVAFQANGIEIPVRAQFPVGTPGGSGSPPIDPGGPAG
jgi:small conductance mechanosensitive channel